jgi:hypothetical protein
MADVGKAAHAVLQDSVKAGVWRFRRRLERQRASIVATYRTYHRRPVPGDQGGLFAIYDVPPRGGTAVGCQDRRRGPLMSKRSGKSCPTRT